MHYSLVLGFISLIFEIRSDKDSTALLPSSILIFDWCIGDLYMDDTDASIRASLFSSHKSCSAYELRVSATADLKAYSS